VEKLVALQLSAVSVHQPDNLVVHLVGAISAGADCSGRAVLQMIPHKLPAYPAQRFVYRRDLSQDVGAVAIFLDHFLETSQLPLDPAESCQVS
jgi:hypothetical protein